MDVMEFLELARNRYSERSFDSKKLDEKELYKILEAGRIAPTACNYQPQRFYVLKSEEALKKAASLTYCCRATCALPGNCSSPCIEVVFTKGNTMPFCEDSRS